MDGIKKKKIMDGIKKKKNNNCENEEKGEFLK
jgi:hypothetical protein